MASRRFPPAATARPRRPRAPTPEPERELPKLFQPGGLGDLGRKATIPDLAGETMATVTVRLPSRYWEALHTIADAYGTTPGAALRSALELYFDERLPAWRDDQGT
jgi:hypothetical protein